MVSIHIFRCLFDHLKAANMVNMVGFIDPALVSADAGSLTERSRLVANRLQKTDGEQIFLMPYNPGLVSKQKTGFCLYDALHIKLFNLYIYFVQPSLGLDHCESKEGDRLFSGSTAWKSCCG